MTAEQKLIDELHDIKNNTTATLLRPIIPIEEWVDSPYYLGETCYELYPKYKQHLKSIFDSERDDSDYIDEVMMRCSIGTGKTSLANVILIRKLYELSCYTDIRPLYNLMTSKKLLMVYFSITKEVAENTGYAQLRDMLFNIPYFQDNFAPNSKKSYDIEFPDNNMAITSGSRALNALGGDVIASVIDEGDFYGDAGSTDTTGANALGKAQSLYASIRKRARSRFMVNGRNFSLNMIISSPTYASSFISKLIDDNRGNPHAYIIEETLWSVKPKGTYSDEMFLVFKGTPVLDPQIVDDPEFYNNLLATLYLPQKQFKSKDPLMCLADLPPDVQQYFIQIPIDFRKEFEIDLITALQDIASVPTAPLGRLFTSEKYYNKAATKQSPFTQQTITISTSKTDTRTIQTYFRPNYKPEHPELPRFVHFDYSTTGDECGVGCSYAKYLGKDKVTGQIVKDITTEWMMHIKPPKKPEEMDLRKCRSILYYMRDVLHLKIGCVTFDSFASEEAIQSLRQDGFTVEKLSLDRDDTPYTEIMQLYYQELYHHPHHDRYKEELFNLVHFRSKHKVDHPEGCFTIDTKIRLVDGRSLSIKDLLIEQQYKTNYVYSITNDGIRPKRILDVFKTKYVSELLEITLDNDEIITCTKEHPFMLRDGSYIEAQYLYEGISLMPLYTEISDEGLPGYRMYYEPLDNSWHYEHIQFCVNFLKDLPLKYIVHHCNCNKLDNTPINLLGMSKSFHTYLHCTLMNSINRYKKVSNSLSEYYKNNKDNPTFIERNNQISKTLKELYSTEDNIIYRIRDLYHYIKISMYDKFSMQELGKRFKDLSVSERNSITQRCNNYLYYETKHKERVNNYETHLRNKFTTKGLIWINNGIIRKYISQDEEIPDGYTKGFKLNHKVKSIKLIHKVTPVYDLTIEDTHNFALDAGVFVHNSDKGVTDGAIGSAYSALIHQDVTEVYRQQDVKSLISTL